MKLQKSVSLGRALLCVVLSVVFCAATVYQFAFYYLYEQNRIDLVKEMAKTTVLQAQYDSLLSAYKARDAQAAALSYEVTALKNKLIAITGSVDGTAEDCLRLLLVAGIRKQLAYDGTAYAGAEEALAAEYMEEYADDYLAVAEKLLFIDYLYRTHYLYAEDGVPSGAEICETVAEKYIAAAADLYGRYYTAEEYAYYLQESSASLSGIGVQTQYVDDGEKVLRVLHVHQNGPSAGLLQAGDIITAVNGSAILSQADAKARVAGAAGTTVSLTVKRGGTLLSSPVTVTRASFVSDAVLYSTVEEAGHTVGYIHVLTFNSKTPEQFVSAYTAVKNGGAEAIVFDVRDNGGGSLSSILKVLNYLLPAGKTIATYEYGNDTLSRASEISADDGNENTLPLYILQNANTASAAELFCAALKKYSGATLIGGTSCGKGVMQTGYRMNDGTYLSVTVASYATGAGESYDRVGITPDIAVSPATGWENESVFLIPADKDTPKISALQKAAADLAGE